MIASEEQRKEWIATIEKYVNLANEAIDETIPGDGLESGEPSSTCGCMLAVNIPTVRIAMPRYIEFDTTDTKKAKAVAKAWGTKTMEHAAYMAYIPDDLRVAVAAFDMGLIPELIDWEMDTEVSDWAEAGDEGDRRMYQIGDELADYERPDYEEAERA